MLYVEEHILYGQGLHMRFNCRASVALSLYTSFTVLVKQALVSTHPSFGLIHTETTLWYRSRVLSLFVLGVGKLFPHISDQKSLLFAVPNATRSEPIAYHEAISNQLIINIL